MAPVSKGKKLGAVAVIERQQQQINNNTGSSSKNCVNTSFILNNNISINCVNKSSILNNDIIIIRMTIVYYLLCSTVVVVFIAIFCYYCFWDFVLHLYR